MPKAKANKKKKAKKAARKLRTVAGMLKRTAADVLPENAIPAPEPRDGFTHRYTTGPFQLPQGAGSLDWTLLNNDATPQQARVTVFQCPVGVAKIPVAPGPLVVTVGPGESTHNANQYPVGFAYEVQVECSSGLVFPYVSVWPGNYGVIIPGTGITSGSFLRQMP